jgi:glycosyltransferase involved in cell wall biosynthesis
MHVIQYMPLGHPVPVQHGADFVTVYQLEYFHRRGWTTDVILPRVAWNRSDPSAFHQHYPWVRQVTLIDLQLRAWELPEIFHGHIRVCGQKSLQEAMKPGADLFFTSYMFTAPLLDLLPRGCARMLDTNDIVSTQFALADGHRQGPGQFPDWKIRAKRDYLFRIERDLLAQFDSNLMISPGELQIVRQAGLTNAVYVPPPMPVVQHPEVEAETDLLFIGGDNPYNAAGIDWFFGNVYLPYLARRGVRLTVVGHVCRKLHLAGRSVRQLGFVPGSLGDFYRTTRLVVAPILEGTGVAIKMLEALSHGRAVVATPVGARGLDLTSGAFACLDMQADPAATANLILDLLASDRKRRRLEEAALAYARTRHSQESYEAAMDQAVQLALSRRSMRACA